MRYGRESRERGHMKHARTQFLSGFEANPSSHITFIIRDAIPGEVE